MCFEYCLQYGNVKNIILRVLLSGDCNVLGVQLFALKGSARFFGRGGEIGGKKVGYKIGGS